MVTIHRRAAFAAVIKGIKFLPGMNTISDAEMKILKEDPRKILDSELDCHNMVMGGQVESAQSEAATPGIDIKTRAANIAKEIEGVNVKVAAEMIAKMGDGYVLRALKEVDGRKGVQEAVDRRLDAIANQEGSDLTPESRRAPDGDGSDFDGDIGSSKEDKGGTKGHSAIPALNKGKKK